MGITIKFPNNEDVTFEQGKPIVVLGANGAGKTRFSSKIEELNDEKYKTWNTQQSLLIHRISAQKSLKINESISIFDLDSATKSLFIGDSSVYASKINSRFSSNPVTGLLNDYEQALSLLFAKNNDQLQNAHTSDVAAYKAGIERPAPITTVVETATLVWNELLPHRKIDLSGNGVHVEYDGDRYHGKEMSDGERVMLYMICQVLVLKPKSVLIIDEPELHIHKAIVDKLWDKLEELRQDCVFVYITHDLNFALSRNTEKVLWIKSFNGTTWDYEFLNIADYSDLPNDLLYEIIGTRQKVLFVEGEKNSYDHFLYQEVFRDKGYHVIPCGGCQDVIKFVKSKRAYEKLNAIDVFGIVDRDFRTEAEITALRDDGVFCIDVAEVENLFVVPELLDLMEEQLGCSENAAQNAKDFIQNLFNQNKANQIGEAFIKEVNHQLTLKNFADKKLTPAEVKECLDAEFSQIKITKFYAEKETQFNSAHTVKEILKIFNFKNLSRKIGTQFGIHGNDYPQRVINLMKRNPNNVKEQIISILSEYIPELPQ